MKKLNKKKNNKKKNNSNIKEKKKNNTKVIKNDKKKKKTKKKFSFKKCLKVLLSVFLIFCITCILGVAAKDFRPFSLKNDKKFGKKKGREENKENFF